MFRFLFLIMLLTTINYNTLGQEEQKKEPNKNKDCLEEQPRGLFVKCHSYHRHRAAILVGYTLVPTIREADNDEQGLTFSATFGFDYEYWIRPRFGIALLNDIELNSYTILTNQGNLLERYFNLVSTPAVVYEFYPNWSLFVGGGIEFDEVENLPVIRLGTEFEVPIRNEWDVAFSMYYDYKKEYSSITLGIVFGKRFGYIE
ncbi:MAG TPA: hypothetical protein DDX92_00310 [Flavobacteriales bacterium]|jgi:hypothetical protein|nr:hypothetical protein [Flavobacteriales bacterium]